MIFFILFRYFQDFEALVIEGIVILECHGIVLNIDLLEDWKLVELLSFFFIKKELW